ncbi:CPBP family intramembrane metalloprotease [Nonomuraea phyllanthi]|uniref:CPBP family intramembrane metalloprotease n=1 Tax=Nonomuraea phyllanthi TaxID=2219224 RepID=A0A5C4WKM2_9ACTN|nr:CPBP family intramembrane glutamic endopeptidase [Nonomuraea phyllanthi]KAB8194516.1 CPBP family intramembrane metalloprotease [Nonomuraea phyllanthi]QFY08942.1 CPBP family intramembrane metalloprotease [Nonomuraea phyllanthi]
MRTESPAAPLQVLTPRLIRAEVLVVFSVSLGASGLVALVRLIGALTAPKELKGQRAVLVGSMAPGRPWLDLTLQLVDIAISVAPVALVAYLLVRSGESLRTIGVDFGAKGRDTVRGALLAAAIGGTGLAFYLAVWAVGVNLTVVPGQLPQVWWQVPVLLLAAAQNGVLEEVLVAGYLLHRLGQAGWGPWKALAVSSLLRGSYHLYQGFGGFVGNVVMGLVFGRLYQRWGRAMPLIVAHTLIDAVAFVGYALLHGHVSWLP